MDIHIISSLTRPLYLANKGNLLIVLITAIVFLSSTAYHYISTEIITTAILSGVKVSLMIFFSWAISRELDPDHAFSAFVPVTLVLITFPLIGEYSILPMVWMIMILRTINRTTGTGATFPDILFIISLGLLLTLKASWLYGMLTGLGLMAESRLSPSDRRTFVAGMITIIAAVSLLPLMPEDMNLPALLFSDYPLLMGITILFLPVILGSSELQSVGDRTGEPLSPTRIRAAQLMSLIVVVSLSIGGVNAWLYVMYCILGGIGIYWIFSGRVTVA